MLHDSERKLTEELRKKEKVVAEHEHVLQENKMLREKMGESGSNNTVTMTIMVTTR